MSESPLNQLRNYLQAEPFRSVLITMRDGQNYLVERAEQVAIGSDNATTFMIAGPQDGYALVTVQEIKEVRYLPLNIGLAGWEGVTEAAKAVGELCQQISTFGEIGWFYRGESRFFTKRVPSLGRYLAVNAPNPIEAECSEVAWFQSRAHSLLDQAELETVRKDILGWLTLMQHHFAPTRLLDWTYSAWVAAYHAAAFDSKHTGFVWGFSPTSFVSKRPAEWADFQSKLDAVETADQYGTVLRSMPSELVLPFHQIDSTQRMVAQQGTFTFGHPPHVDHALVIGKYVEPGKAKVMLIPNLLKRELFERMRSMNLSAASLFPGLDGVGKTTLETMRVRIGTPWAAH